MLDMDVLSFFLGVYSETLVAGIPLFFPRNGRVLCPREAEHSGVTFLQRLKFAFFGLPFLSSMPSGGRLPTDIKGSPSTPSFPANISTVGRSLTRVHRRNPSWVGSRAGILEGLVQMVLPLSIWIRSLSIFTRACGLGPSSVSLLLDASAPQLGMVDAKTWGRSRRSRWAGDPLVPYPPLGPDLTPTPWGEPSPSQGGGMASEWCCK